MRLEDGLLVAKQVLGHCGYSCTQGHLKVETVRLIIRQHYKIDAVIHSGNSPPEIYAQLHRKQDFAHILVKENEMSYCWQRFVACKELAHLLIDSEGSYTHDVPALVRDLVLHDLPLLQDHPAEMTSERLAKIVACEILMPWQCRAIMDKMLEDGRPCIDIAKHFLVPEKIVQQRMDPAWIVQLETAHRDLDVVPAIPQR